MMRKMFLWIGMAAGPALVMLAGGAIMIAWQAPDLGLKLHWSLVSIITGCWALWALVSAPSRLPRWLFFPAFALNLYLGASLVNNSDAKPIERAVGGGIFLLWSLWQFWVWRSRAPKVVGPSS